jgi:Tol biopolymer transport system component
VDSIWGQPQLDLSASGTLVYVAGEDWSRSVPTWVDGEGREEPLQMPAANYNTPRLSADGRRLAVHVTGPRDQIEIYDVERAQRTRLALEGSCGFPAWNTSGDRLLFTCFGDSPTVYSKAIDSQASPRRVIDAAGLGREPVNVVWMAPYAASTDRYVTLDFGDPDLLGEIWLVPLQGDEKPRPLVSSERHEAFGAISPDGRWLAYASNKTETWEIFVRSLESSEVEKQISSGGGEEPLWSSRGDEVFYRNADRIMRVQIETEPVLRAELPRLAVRGDYHQSAGLSYDVAPDGKRFIVNKPVGEGRVATEIRVIEGFFAELERLVPTGR